MECILTSYLLGLLLFWRMRWEPDNFPNAWGGGYRSFSAENSGCLGTGLVSPWKTQETAAQTLLFPNMHAELGQLWFLLGLFCSQKLNPLFQLQFTEEWGGAFFLDSCCKTESLKCEKAEVKANCSIEHVCSLKRIGVMRTGKGQLKR